MEEPVRSSEHLRDALDLRVIIDRDGKSKVVRKDKLSIKCIGIRRRGEKGFKFKTA